MTDEEIDKALKACECYGIANPSVAGEERVAAFAVALAKIKELEEKLAEAVKAAPYCAFIEATPKNQLETMLYNTLTERDLALQANKALLANASATIGHLHAENTASMREIALARERADKAEAEVATLRSMLSGAAEQIFDKYVLDIQAYEDRALAAEAEVVALREANTKLRTRFDEVQELRDQEITEDRQWQALLDEVAALRKRLVVDDEMVERAVNTFFRSLGKNGAAAMNDDEAMRAALDAALGRDEDNA